MIPVYISYFAGGKEKNTTKTVKNALGFIAGFTVVFVCMGALAGSVGSFLNRYTVLLNIITGVVVIFFGLHFLGVFKANIFKGMKRMNTEDLGVFSSMLFGIVFSVGWTPCVGGFLGSALMLAAGGG